MSNVNLAGALQEGGENELRCRSWLGRFQKRVFACLSVMIDKDPGTDQ